MAVEGRRATLGAEVDRARRGLPDERDRGLLLELTSGVCRWRAELDACLKACSERPLDTIDPPLLATLRVAMYQLRHLDRIPAHAVLNESVEAARVLDAPRAAGFVNGVLRAYLRTKDEISLPSRPEASATRRQQLAYLSVTLSHPRWLVARWLDRYGFDETEAWCRFNNAAPDLTVRARGRGADAAALINTLEQSGVHAARGLYASDVVRLAPGVLGTIDPGLRRDLLVQDEGSVVVAHAAGARPGERVLDLCAAPGGKTMILWADMNAQGSLIASDTRPARMQILRETLHDAGIPERLTVLDATRPLPFGPDTFDRVFVDVPCSGLGTLRRDPDVKWAVTRESLPGLAATQRRILSHAASVVRPGGTLIYATCSSEPEENDEIVDAFLADSSSFAAEAIDAPSAFGALGFGALIDERGRLRTTPSRHGLDAFFAARLVARPR
jgi:16S rRNA (cytosine967-C5)-methyltransferase